MRQEDYHVEILDKFLHLSDKPYMDMAVDIAKKWGLFKGKYLRYKKFVSDKYAGVVDIRFRVIDSMLSEDIYYSVEGHTKYKVFGAYDLKGDRRCTLFIDSHDMVVLEIDNDDH